jgi:hypothetical protein
MSFERPGMGLGAEPAPTPGPAELPTRDGLTPAMRLQILSTEHWSLLASRSLAWNESFARAGMFLSTLSGAIVALALVAQASAFGEGFVLFALVILPVVLFVGITTFLRMGASNYHDAMCVVGMNRIRAGYLELAPDLERFFVMGTTDDERGISLTMATDPHVSWPVHLMAGTPTVVTVLNAVLLAVIASLVALHLGSGTTLALVVGVLGFVVGFALQGWYATRGISRGVADYRPQFPTPEEE